MELTNKQVDAFWTAMIIVKYFIFAFMVVIFCSCSATQPKGIVVRDVKYHMTFNREVMKGDTLIKIERWKSITNGVEQDSIINEQVINALVLFHNMHLEHENL